MDCLDQQLSELTALSEKIVLLANEQEWKQIELLDRQRLRLLERLFSNRYAADMDAATVKQLRHISLLTTQALQLCTQSRETLLNERHRLSHGKAAIAAYNS